MAPDRNAGGAQLLGVGRMVHQNSSQSCSCAAVASNDGSNPGLRWVLAHKPSFSLRPRRIGRRVSLGKGRAKIRATSSVERERAKAGRERPERQSLTLSYIPEQGPIREMRRGPVRLSSPSEHYTWSKPRRRRRKGSASLQSGRDTDRREMRSERVIPPFIRCEQELS
jgi:hypothetical protein